jgi:hypothetical protein
MTRRLQTFVPLAALLGLAALTAPAEAQDSVGCCGPISPKGHRLSDLLDSTGVDHLWKDGVHVSWSTGEPDAPRPDGSEEKSHCSAFVAAIASRLGIYVLRPPEHPQELLASAQTSWLRTDGAARGWRTLPNYREAQEAANRGELVLEAFESPDPHRPGHIAIVRPSDKSLATLNAEGPQETQAGTFNAISVSTARGFAQHHGAWIQNGGGSLAYYAHTIEAR